MFRTENIAKDYFQFAEWEYIESELTRLLSELKSENFLANLTKEKFTERLAYYWAELNVLHPFREGNGRTTREFLRQLSLKNGYILNCMHGNEGCYVYLKEVLHGEALVALSSEERKALEEALNCEKP